MQFWNELEGQTIDGTYPLRRLVRSEGRSAWFETQTEGVPATISLTEALTDADEVTARLKAAREVTHKNLVGIGEVGQVKIDNTLIVYAIMEHIDQSLSDVLQSQALSADEGREVAEALVGALTTIHNNGMSHGHVEAASVLATEETVKLRSDCLQNNPSGQGDDIAGIGATLFHAFTQRKALTATDAQINRIPAPFAEIVRNSFGRRWTLAQIANALKPGVTSARPAAAASTAAAVGSAAQRPAPAAVSTPAPVAATAPVAKATPTVGPQSTPAPAPTPRVADRPKIAPAAAAVAEAPRADIAPERYVPRTAEPMEPAAGKKPLGLYAVIAVVLLAIVGWLLWRPKPVAAPAANSTPTVAEQAPAPSATTPAPATSAPATKPSASKPSAASASSRHKPAPVPSAAPAEAASDAGSGRHVWRVVVYTYRGQTKADAAVATISAKHPNLHATVFNPTGSDVYMVVLGGPMDHDHANAMLDKARREGLPADTYVRNFTE